MKAFSRMLATVCATLTVASFSAPAVGQQCSFNFAGISNWDHGSFWSCLHAPTAPDWVWINNGGTARVTDPQSCGLLEIGYNTTNYSRLLVDLAGTLSSSALSLHRGEVTVDGAGCELNIAGASSVGLGGDGNLIVQNAGVVNSNGYATVGYNFGDSAVRVVGAGSAWNAAGGLTVGGAEGVNSSVTGTLTLSNGGIGNVTGGLTLAVSGSTGTLNIGDGGAAGILNASNVASGGGTATLNFNHTDANYFFTRNGMAVGTPIPITGSVKLNHLGDGVTVLVAQNTYTGDTAVRNGILKVDGGSIASASAKTLVGDQSGEDGTLNITNSGTVSHGGIGIIGNANGSTGSVIVHGATSTWDVDSLLYVGVNGTGNLNIQSGGAVSSNFGNIAFDAAGTGTATIDGAGSEWTISNDLAVGANGDGTLTLRTIGAVSVSGNLRLARFAGSTGTLNIGSGGVPGIVNAASVQGVFAATLNFNHNHSNYFFTRNIAAGGTPVAITGSTAVNHIGAGTTTLLGNNTYTGATTVDAGKLLVNGSIANSTVTVTDGGILGGTGTIQSPVNVGVGGTLAPGASPGRLTCGNGVSISQATLKIEITGETPGSGYDQLTVTGGNVNLGSQTVVLAFPTLSGTFASTARLFIIANTGAGTTAGTFFNLPDGGSAGTPVPALAELGGYAEWRLYYHADSGSGQLTGGNDIALAPVPSIVGDIDADSYVDFVDLDLFVGVLLGTNTDPQHIARSDVNGDTRADGLDAQIMVAALVGG